MKKHTFGLIGLGVISKYFVSAVQKNPSTELVAVSARTRRTLDSFNADGVTRYENYQDLLSDPRIQAVIIATPNNTHEEIIRTALHAGKHVLCEKPLTIGVESTRELVGFAHKKDLLLMTVFHRRYNRELASLFVNKDLQSRIIRIHARYLENIADHSGSTKWHYNLKESGGGCVIDNGINVIDVIQTLVGELSLESAQFGLRGEGITRHDATALLNYKFKKGLATIELDWYYAGEVKDIVIYLEDGSTICKDMLAGSAEFKGSLWHEYEGALQEFVLQLESGVFKQDLASIRAIAAVHSAYKNL